MTGDELKAALMDERPVIHDGITYQKITAVIYRRSGRGKRIRVSAELLDQNSRDVVIAPAEKVKDVCGAEKQ